MFRLLSVALTVFAAVLSTGCAGDRPVADLAYTNGKIYTVDGRSRWVDAVAVKDGRFIMVGDEVDVGEVTGASTRVIDLERQFVMPGLIDRDGDAGSGAIAPELIPSRLMAIQRLVTEGDETLSVGQAIALHTRDAATSRNDPDVGSIVVGKLAEMIVLDRNPFQMPQDAMASVEVVRVITADAGR